MVRVWLTVGVLIGTFPGTAWAETAPLVIDGFVGYERQADVWHVIGDYGVASLCNDHATEQRGLMEFRVSDVTMPARTATLTIWQLDRISAEGTISLYAYPGNGRLAIDDFGSEGVFVSHVDFPVGYNFGDGVPFDTDVTPAMQLGWVNGWDILGLRLQAEQVTSQSPAVYAADGSPDFGGQPPRLVYETTYPGDATLDGWVNDNDLSVLLSNYWKLGMGWTQGDFSGDGFIADNDLSLLLAHWTGAVVYVPGPATAALLALGSLAVLKRHGCR